MAGDDALLRARRLAENFACHGFVHRDGQDQGAGFVACLHVLLQKRHFLEFAFLENLVRHFVEGKRQFVVFVDAVIVVPGQVAPFFGGDHLAHQFDGRVVLAGVFHLAACHDGFVEGILQRSELYVQGAGFLDAQMFRLVPDHGHAQFACLERQGETAVQSGLCGAAVFADHVDKRQCLARFPVGYGTCQRLGRHGDCQKEKKQKR